MAEQHGGVQSAVTGRVKAFHGFELAGHVLGSLACLITTKTKKAGVLLSLSVEAHINFTDLWYLSAWTVTIHALMVTI